MLSFNYVKFWILLLYLSVKGVSSYDRCGGNRYCNDGYRCCSEGCCPDKDNTWMLLVVWLILLAMCSSMKKKAHHGQLDTPEATDPESLRPLDHTNTWTHDQQAQNGLISNILFNDCVNETDIDKNLLANVA